MRDITVLDILSLPIMANAELKAGQSGLSNIVSYVNVLDNYYDDTESSPINYGQNFYLTSMYYGINNEPYIEKIIRHFIDLNVSAVCIIDEYMSELPASAYKLADEYQVPIIFIDSNTPYALIISSIMELKLSYQESGLHENLLHEILLPHCSDQRKKEILNQMNPNFHNYVIAFFCRDIDNSTNDVSKTPKELHLLNKIHSYKDSFACPYRNGVVIVRSYNSSETSGCKDICKAMIQTIRDILPDSLIGISEPMPLTRLDESIAQCNTASLSASHSANGITTFSEIGIAQLLIKFINHPDLDAYYHSLLNPLNKHDKKYNSDLLKTVKCFIECNLDHVKTGKTLHIHENTVRYRLNKIKELIPYGKTPLDFNQSIYILYKILKIKEVI